MLGASGGSPADAGAGAGAGAVPGSAGAVPGSEGAVPGSEGAVPGSEGATPGEVRAAAPPSPEGSVRDLLEYLARGLVERPERVRVRELPEEEAIVLELSVDDGDYGNVIGRGGRTANALRTVIKSAAARRRQRVFVDIVDT